jgi:hypothetical protein
MKKSLLTYFRSSATMRVLSAMVFIVLTGSSVVAGNCSSCAMKSQDSGQSAACPMPRAADNQIEGQIQGNQIQDQNFSDVLSSCCCSSPKAISRTVQTTKQSPASSCAVADYNTEADLCVELPTNKTNDFSQESGTSAVVSAPANQTTPGATENSTCGNSSSCQNQLQDATHATSPPPPRSIEQERQDKLTIQIPSNSFPLLLERLTSRLTDGAIVLSGVPPSLSGIGSHLLIC